MSSKGLNVLKALPKGFAAALPTRYDSHLGNLTLVSHFKRPSLISLLILSWPIWPSFTCHIIDSKWESKCEIKIEEKFL